MKNSWKHCTYDLQLWVLWSICSSEAISRHDINREAAGRIARSDSWNVCQECGIIIFGWLELELFLVGCISHLHSSLAENGPSCLVPVGRVDASFDIGALQSVLVKPMLLQLHGKLLLHFEISRSTMPHLSFDFLQVEHSDQNHLGRKSCPKIFTSTKGPWSSLRYFERCYSIVSQREATNTSYQLVAWSQFQSIEIKLPQKIARPNKENDVFNFPGFW